MLLRDKYHKILSGIVPAGAAGIALLLGSAVPSAAARHPTNAEPQATDNVAERLAAIREAVSDVAKARTAVALPADDELRLAWGNWWRNLGWRPGGWGWPNWNNWRNWNKWRNWWHNW